VHVPAAACGTSTAGRRGAREGKMRRGSKPWWQVLPLKEPRQRRQLRALAADVYAQAAGARARGGPAAKAAGERWLGREAGLRRARVRSARPACHAVLRVMPAALCLARHARRFDGAIPRLWRVAPPPAAAPPLAVRAVFASPPRPRALVALSARTLRTMSSVSARSTRPGSQYRAIYCGDARQLQRRVGAGIAWRYERCAG